MAQTAYTPTCLLTRKIMSPADRRDDDFKISTAGASNRWANPTSDPPLHQPLAASVENRTLHSVDVTSFGQKRGVFKLMAGIRRTMAGPELPKSWSYLFFLSADAPSGAPHHCSDSQKQQAEGDKWRTGCCPLPCPHTDPNSSGEVVNRTACLNHTSCYRIIPFCHTTVQIMWSWHWFLG